MKPNNIFIVRHGQSFGNANKLVYSIIPDWKIELTNLGHHQSEQAGKIIAEKIGTEQMAVYVSPFKRTRETLQSMQKNIPESSVKFVKEDPRLREQEWGNLQEHVDIEMEKARDFHGSFFFRIPNGESGADVYDRCSGFLDTLYRDFEKRDFPNNVLIVTHGYTMCVLLKKWLHWTVEDFHKLDKPMNCKIVQLKRNRDTDKFNLLEPMAIKP